MYVCRQLSTVLVIGVITVFCILFFFLLRTLLRWCFRDVVGHRKNGKLISKKTAFHFCGTRLFFFFLRFKEVHVAVKWRQVALLLSLCVRLYVWPSLWSLETTFQFGCSLDDALMLSARWCVFDRGVVTYLVCCGCASGDVCFHVVLF